MLRQKPTQIFALKVTERSNHSFLLFDASCFLDICTKIELKELNWLCKHMKTSGAANLVFQRIFVLNSVKLKFSHVSIVKTFIMQKRKIRAEMR